MLYVISDLHLSLGIDKPMDIFGGRWDNYMEKLKKNWQVTVGKDDTVVIPGDISWGMTFEDSLPDFRFLNELNGRKLILKGNHDYFWNTAKKLYEFFRANRLESIDIIHNNAYMKEGVALCGTKGHNWDKELSASQNGKLLNREAGRLEASLQAGEKVPANERVVFLHYPPLLPTYRADPIIEVMKKHGVKRCYFGHIHGSGRELVPQGDIEGIEMCLVSSDHLEFKPKKIN